WAWQYCRALRLRRVAGSRLEPEKYESGTAVKNDKCAAFTTSENRMPICAEVRARQDSINIARLCTTASADHAASDRAETPHPAPQSPLSSARDRPPPHFPRH